MASKRKNSLVNNINRRKRAGKSRPKSKSTVSKTAYRDMQQGWTRPRKKKAGAKRKATKRRGSSKAARKK